METAREAAERVLNEIRGIDTPKRTQKQALAAAVIELQRATLAVGDLLLDETPEVLTQSFSEADLAYAGGYLGSISALVNRLSQFIRNYPTA